MLQFIRINVPPSNYGISIFLAKGWGQFQSALWEKEKENIFAKKKKKHRGRLNKDQE